MVRNVAIVMNGVTGRMGTRQHLVRSVLAIREQGGVVLPDGEVVVPDPILVGRNENKLRSLAEAHGIERWSTDLDESFADPKVEIYFDSQTTAHKRGASFAGKGGRLVVTANMEGSNGRSISVFKSPTDTRWNERKTCFLIREVSSPRAQMHHAFQQWRVMQLSALFLGLL